MEWYEDEVSQMQRLWKKAPPPIGATVFYGSSSIRLWSSLKSDFPNRNVVNAGFGGSTLAACVHFCDRLLLPLRPSSIVVYAGDNDLGDGRTPEAVRDSWKELNRRIDADLGQVPLLFMSIKPSPARWSLFEKIRATNEMIRAELISRQNGIYVDLLPSMLTPEGKPRTELYAEDGLHLSQDGYRLWREILEPHLARLG